MLDRFKLTKVLICQSFSFEVKAGAPNQKTGANGEKHLTMAWCCSVLLEKMVLSFYLPLDALLGQQPTPSTWRPLTPTFATLRATFPQLPLPEAFFCDGYLFPVLPTSP